MRRAGFGLLPTVHSILTLCILFLSAASIIPIHSFGPSVRAQSELPRLLVVDRLEAQYAVLVPPAISGEGGDGSRAPEHFAPVVLELSVLADIAGRSIKEGDYLTIEWAGADENGIPRSVTVEVAESERAVQRVRELLERLSGL